MAFSMRKTVRNVLTARLPKFAVATILILILAGVAASGLWVRYGSGSPLSKRTFNAPFNGFDISNATIPEDEILLGGVPRDGIPAILEPKFMTVDEVDFLPSAELVVAFSSGGESKAYPLGILVWHEVVNDVVGGTPVAITYCPLCGTSMVFNRRIGGKVLTFGVSGLLYNSDVLMYDHQTESLWSQLKMESVAGESVGSAMEWLHSEEMTWAAWKQINPDGKMLSPDTGFSRLYGRDNYARYKQSEFAMFPVPTYREELARKDWVVGILADGKAKAYPRSLLEQRGSEAFRDTVGQTEVEITYDTESHWASIVDAQSGESIPSVNVYWFAWQAFYPDTELYVSESPFEAEDEAVADSPAP